MMATAMGMAFTGCPLCAWHGAHRSAGTVSPPSPRHHDHPRFEDIKVCRGYKLAPSLVATVAQMGFGFRVWIGAPAVTTAPRVRGPEVFAAVRAQRKPDGHQFCADGGVRLTRQK